MTGNSQTTAARSIAELVFPVGVALLPFGLVIQQAIPANTVDIVFIALTLFAAAMVATYTRLPPSVVLLACAGVGIVAITQRPNLFALTLIPVVAFVLQHTDARVMIRRFLKVSGLLFALVVGLYLIVDFNKGYDVEMWRAYSSELMDRLSVGFSHPNRAMMEWSVIAIGVLAFTTVRGRALWALPIAAVTGALYLATDSRTSAGLTVVFLVLATLGRRKFDSPVGPGLRVLAIVAPAGFAVLSFSLVSLTAFPEINALLSGRPAIYAGLMRDYSLLAPFGTPAVEEAIVDNGFLQQFFSKGPLLAVFYIVMLGVLIARPKRISRRTVLILFVFMASAVFETTLMSFPHLFLLLASLEVDRRTEVVPESAEERGRRFITAPAR